jgi:hypothetical protein
MKEEYGVHGREENRSQVLLRTSKKKIQLESLRVNELIYKWILDKYDGRF